MDQILDISEDGRHLSRERGFLKVETAGQIVARIPLDQIAAVIVHAHGTTWSNSLLVALAEQGTTVTLCSSNHMPQAIIWPLDGHHAQGARMRAQWTASLPLMKQAWRQIVVAKIGMQAAALEAVGQPRAPLDMIGRTVRSGDTSNAEAQAARAYWPLLMGREFRRDPSGDGANALLNYGYTVLRIAAARAVVGAGLHPTIGLFHSNRGNTFALADDLMEPFRPLVDLVARAVARSAGPAVTPEAKREMARLIAFDLLVGGESSPVSVALSRLAVSLAQSFKARKIALLLPDAPSALALASLGR